MTAHIGGIAATLCGVFATLQFGAVAYQYRIYRMNRKTLNANRETLEQIWQARSALTQQINKDSAMLKAQMTKDRNGFTT